MSGPIEPLDEQPPRPARSRSACSSSSGMATGWGRVLLATPGLVDNRRKGDHRL